MKKRNILLIQIALLTIVCTKCFASDVMFKNEYGQSIYYNWIKGGTELSVSTSYDYKGFIIIPESVDYLGNTYRVTSIGNKAFRDCSYLTSVSIPRSVTSIGEEAFAHSGITSITIPNEVKSIGDRAFSYCEKLSYVTIPNGVTSIGEEAFSYSGLISVYIPNSVVSFGKNAFWYCEKLSSVKIQKGLKVIPENAFLLCNSLVSINIPNGVITIGKQAFGFCSSLKIVTLPNTLKEIEDFAFVGCILESIVIPKSVDKLGRDLLHWGDRLNKMKCIILEGHPSEIHPEAFQAIDGDILILPEDWDISNLNYPNMPCSWEDDGKIVYGFYGASFPKISNNGGDAITAITPNSKTTEYPLEDILDDNTKVDNKVDGSIYYHLNSDTDGYDTDNNCLVINSTTDNSVIAETTGGVALEGGGIPDAFNGLIVYQGGGETCGGIAYGESGETLGTIAYGESGETLGSVAYNNSGESCGSVGIDYQTQGNRQLCIKIGDKEPVMLASSERTTADIPFQLKDDTYILLYSVSNTVATRAHASSDCVKLFGNIKFTVNDDYHRAFSLGYLNESFYNKPRKNQITSLEFKSMLKDLINKFASGSINYFDMKVSDVDIPLTRGMAAMMVYYAARCVSVETSNSLRDANLLTDRWDGFYDREEDYKKVFPDCVSMTETANHESKWWRSVYNADWVVCWTWNLVHVSRYSGSEVVAIDWKNNKCNWADAFTWEDAIRAITRLLDSEIEKISLPIGGKGFTTYTSKEHLDFSGFGDDVKAYIATGYDYDNGTVWLTRVKDVPAGTPLMVKGTASQTYNIPVKASSGCYYKNMLVGNLSGGTITIGGTTAGMTDYYLKNGSFLSADGTNTIGNGKAYLQIPTTPPAATVGSSQSVKLNDYGFASFCGSQDLDFSDVEGLKAFAVTGYDDANGTIWLTRVNRVSAQTPLLLKGESKGSYTVPSVAVGSYYANMMKGNLSGSTITIFTTDGDMTNYYLKGNQLLKATDGGNTIGNGKAYMQIPSKHVTRSMEDIVDNLMYGISADEPEMISIPVVNSRGIDGDGTTGIHSIENGELEMENDVYFNLQGQRVENPTKGIYLKNGKKVVIK